MERTKTSIKGFDNLVGGGFPKGSNILLSGTPGTGKTIFALQYLVNGAAAGEKGVYITFEEEAHNLKEQARQFGWDLDALEKKGVLKVITIPSSNIKTDLTHDIKEIASREKINRLVIDSLSTLAINTPTVYSKVSETGEFLIKRFVYSFIDDLKKIKDVTTLLISQTSDADSMSKDKISEFTCDGIIQISFEAMGGEFSRSLLVRKMRRTNNNEDIHPLEISKKGVVIHTLK